MEMLRDISEQREQLSSIKSDSLEVRTSLIPGAGNGLFALKDYEPNDILCEYTGSRLTLLQTMRLKDKTYLMGGFGLNCHIDAKDHPDVLARYINDARDEARQNAKFVKLKVAKKAQVVAIQPIKAGDEIYASYGPVYWRYRDL